MAQYGNNLYGASYYGINGVFAGQFMSDETALPAPLPDAPPDAGEPLIIDLYLNHTRVDYNAALEFGTMVISAGGVWTKGASSIYAASSDMALSAALTGASMVVKFIQRGADGAVMDINVTKHTESNGTLASETFGTTYTIDTRTTTEFAIPNQTFGNYTISITRNSSSEAGSYCEFAGITARTTDISFELRTSMNGVSWSEWAVPGTVTSTYDQATDKERITWTTGDMVGLLKYQFKVVMASSDNTTTPEVTKLWIHAGKTDEYRESGYWKMIIDLGSDWNPAADTINSVTYASTTPASTNAYIRSRVTSDTMVLTSEDLASWEYWTVPYSSSATRVLLDIKNDPGAVGNNEGYIISPLINPSCLTNWISFLPKLFVSSIDPMGIVSNSFTSAVIDILDENLVVIVAGGKKQSFTYKANSNTAQGIADIKQKCRVKVTLKRNLNQSTPAVDNVLLSAAADYTEVRSFGAGVSELKGYGSAIFGEGTGIDAVYTNGVARSTLASISNLAFVFPQADTLSGKVTIQNPSYTITNINMPNYDGVRLYWGSQKSNENKSNVIHLENDLTDDYVMAEVKADGTKIKKHYQYGSGITLKVSNLENDNFDSCIISNAFSPAIDITKLYAYLLSNGFPNGEPNENVDIRWNVENTLVPRQNGDSITDLSKRRNVTCEAAQQVNASIAIVTTGAMSEWKSEERIFDASVNIGSPSTPRTTKIHLDSTFDLPEIPGSVVIEENPYKVEIVNGSIVSEGEIREDDRVVLVIDNSQNTYSIASEERAPIVKSGTAIDYLPKHRTTEVRGIYTALTQYSPLYTEADPDDYSTGDFIIREDRCTIDWTPAIGRGETIPSEGDVLYVSYSYEKLDGLDVEATCSYNKNEYDMLNIYRTSVKYYTGRCSYGIDYKSQPYSITELWIDIPSTVDKSSLMLKAVSTDNDLVACRVEDNVVIGSLGDNDPRTSWNPHIRDGFYYIGKNQYYLSTRPYEQELSDEHLPNAQNVTFAPGTIGNGLLMQEATQNILTNNRLDVLDELEQVFIDTFER